MKKEYQKSNDLLNRINKKIDFCKLQIKKLKTNLIKLRVKNVLSSIKENFEAILLALALNNFIYHFPTDSALEKTVYSLIGFTALAIPIVSCFVLMGLKTNQSLKEKRDLLCFKKGLINLNKIKNDIV